MGGDAAAKRLGAVIFGDASHAPPPTSDPIVETAGATQQHSQRFSFFDIERQKLVDQLRHRHERSEALRQQRRLAAQQLFASSSSGENEVVLHRATSQSSLNSSSLNAASLSDTVDAAAARRDKQTRTERQHAVAAAVAASLDEIAARRCAASDRSGAAQTDSFESVRMQLAQSTILLEAVNHASVLCSSVLVRTLPASIYHGPTEARAAVERRHRQSILDAGESGNSTVWALTATLDGAERDLSGKALLERKHARAAEEARRVQNSAPVNHPVQAAADLNAKWLSASRPTLVRPPLQCAPSPRATSGDHGRRRRPATHFDEPDRKLLMPLAGCDAANDDGSTEGERAAARSVADLYARFALRAAQSNVMRDADVLLGTARSVIVAASLRLAASLRADPRAKGRATRAESLVDVTDFVVANREDEERIAMAAERRNADALRRQIGQLRCELFLFLTGIDHRGRSTDASDAADVPFKVKPPPLFDWQMHHATQAREPAGARQAHAARNVSSTDAAGAHRDATKSLRALRLTNEKFRQAAEAAEAQRQRRARVLQHTHASFAKMCGSARSASPTAAQSAVASTMPDFGRSVDAPPAIDADGASDAPDPAQLPQQSDDEPAHQEDLTIGALREGLAAIRQRASTARDGTTGTDDRSRHGTASTDDIAERLAAWRGSSGSDAAARSTEQSVTEQIVGPKAAAVVEKLKAVRAGTLGAPEPSWYEQGSVAAQHPAVSSARRARDVQVGRFNLQSCSPAVNLALTGRSGLAPAPPPSDAARRLGSARTARFTSWTF